MLPTITHTHTRELKARIPWSELESVITSYAVKSASKDFQEELSAAKAHSVKYEVSIVRRTEGSPSYAVNKWEAFVTITVDLT
jgi:hypothetical protein